MMSNQTESATFANGCFWCTEAVFQRLEGVKSVTSGYTGGSTQNPTYQQVSSGLSDHVEAVQITFDPETISFTELLDIFWQTHDPTSLNRQGYDVGPQYRSVIFYHNEAQQQQAQGSKQLLESSGKYQDPVVTTIEPFTNFYEAEDNHKNYYNTHTDQPYCQLVISPKLKKLEEIVGEKLKLN